jgi:hypothetical protein
VLGPAGSLLWAENPVGVNLVEEAGQELLASSPGQFLAVVLGVK